MYSHHSKNGTNEAMVPTGLIALWKMHNWQYIQNGLDNDTIPEQPVPLGL